MQTHISTNGTTLCVFVTVIVNGVHTDPDGWAATPNSANVVITSQPSATHTGTRISQGNYKFLFTGLTAIADGTVETVEINGAIATVAWTEWIEQVLIRHNPNPVGFNRAQNSIVAGTVGTGSTTTSVVSSALSPAAASADQHKNKVLTFANDTTTAALRGQTCLISAATASATPTFTVSTLTAAPVSGDTFTIT